VVISGGWGKISRGANNWGQMSYVGTNVGPMGGADVTSSG